MSVLAAILLALAVVAAQVLHGGLLVPAFTIPAYGLLVVAAIPAFLSIWRKSAPGSVGGISAIAVFVAYIAWRCGHAPDPYLGRTELQLALAGGLAFFVASVGLRDNRSRLIFLFVIGLAAVAQAAVGLLQLAWENFSAPFGWHSKILELQYEGRFLTRARGFFLNPNQLAWLMTWSALFCVSLAAWARVGVVRRVILIYFSLVFIATTVLTGSRGGMVSLLVGLSVFTLLSFVAITVAHRRGRLGLLVGALALLGLCVGVGLAVFSSNWMTQGRVEATFNVEDPRAVLLENAWRQFQVSPLLGVGPGMFLYAARLYRTGGQVGDPIFAHDDWIQTLADYGLVGFALALLAFLILFGGGFRRLLDVVGHQVGSDERLFSNSVALLVGALSALAAFFVHSFVDFNVHVPANALLAGASLGLLTGTMRPSNERTVAQHLQEGMMRVLGAMALVLLAGGVGSMLWRHAVADFESLRAQNFLQDGEVFQALAATDRGQRWEPNNTALLLARGEALYSYLSAVQGAEKPVGLPLTPQKLRELFNGAVEANRLALKQQPAERATEMALAKSLSALKREPEARKHLIEAIRLDPGTSFAYSAYAENLYDDGDWPRAIRILEIASNLPPWREPSDRLWEIRAEMVPAEEAP